MATSKGLCASVMTFSRRRDLNAARTVVRPSWQTLGSSMAIGLRIEALTAGIAPTPLITIDAGWSLAGARTCLTGSSSLMEPWIIVRLLSNVVAGTLCSSSKSLRSLEGVRATTRRC